MVANTLSDYIAEKGIKQSALARALGVSPQTMSEILSGNRKLKADEYIDICDFLEVSYDRFVKTAPMP